MKPIIIGHRGVAGHYPENTKVSIEAAANLGLKWVEVDVQPTKDGSLVVIHDFTVDRCSDHHGAVESLSLAEIKQLDFGSWFEKPEYQQEEPQRILTLKELLELTGRLGLSVNLELKLPNEAYSCRKYNESEVAELVLQALSQVSFSGEIILSSFNAELLFEIRNLVLSKFTSLAKAFEVALLSEKFCSNTKAWVDKLSVSRCNLDYRNLTETDLRYLKNRGLKVWCYTVNQPKDFPLLSEVDGVFSDYPERFK